jgi:hypothetical protein
LKQVVVIALLAATMLLVSVILTGCITVVAPQAAATNTPEAAATQTPPAPTAVPKPTDVPTAAPKPTGIPAAATKPAAPASASPAAKATTGPASSTSPVAKATTGPSASSKPSGAPAGGAGNMDPEMIKAMAVMFPTAPPAPKGAQANLAQSDWGGKWEGWMTIDVFKSDTMKAEEQKSCDEAMAVLKGKQIPMTGEFTPTSSDAGTVTFISGDGSQNPDLYNYKYSNGTLTIDKSEAGAKVYYEGKTLKPDSGGLAITGIWKFSGDLGMAAQSSAAGSIEGTWTLFKK